MMFYARNSSVGVRRDDVTMTPWDDSKQLFTNSYERGRLDERRRILKILNDESIMEEQDVMRYWYRVQEKIERGKEG